MRIQMILPFFLSVTVAFAQESVQKPSSIVVLRGPNYAFSIGIPESWKLDTNKRALQFASRAVLYAPTLGSGGCTIQIIPATKSVEGNNTLANLLAYSARFDSSQGARHIQEQPWTTTDARTVLVFTSAFKDWETVNAYIEDTDAVIVLSLFQPDFQARHDAHAALEAVARSFSSVWGTEKK